MGIAKRSFDLAIATLGVVLLAPVFLMIAVWIKVESPGPVFFRQVRVGRFGKPFRIHKFRTMVHGAPNLGPAITVAGDHRITGAGRVLRKYKLDELAQLIDVIQGSMSLVGPRPEVPQYVDHYSSYYRERVLSLRPGITDPASLEFIDESDLLSRSSDPEATYLAAVLPRKLQLYDEYSKNASFGGDLKILLRTAAALFRRARPDHG